MRVSYTAEVHWRVGRTLGSCRSISEQTMILSVICILYKHCSVDIGDSVFSILTQFLSNRSQHVPVDGCQSKLVNVVSGVPQVSVSGPFTPAHLGAFSILENTLIGYADDSTLMAVVPSPGVRITVTESMISDICRVSKWCDLRGMKLNASMNRTVIVSRSRIMLPCHPHQLLAELCCRSLMTLIYWESDI